MMAGSSEKMMRETMAETSLLVAEVTGATQLAEKLGAAEADRAVERALARAERSVQAYQGSRIPGTLGKLAAHFPRSDGAALAANDMIKRISQLPPVSGVSLSVRIVLHTGRGKQGGGVDADSIELALSLLPFASPGQILVSNDAVSKLSDSMRANINAATQMHVSSGGFEVPLVELQPGNHLVTQAVGPLTVPPHEPTIMPSSRPLPVRPAPAVSEAPRSRLLLRYHGASLLVSEFKPIMLAGREEANDIVITDRRASRQHARIEWRKGRFMLIDSSTNGTYLVDAHGVEVLLKNGECEMPPHGRIGCGYSPLEAGCEPMVYDIGERQSTAQ